MQVTFTLTEGEIPDDAKQVFCRFGDQIVSAKEFYFDPGKSSLGIATSLRRLDDPLTHGVEASRLHALVTRAKRTCLIRYTPTLPEP
jgi:hypothetical protein